MIYFITIIYKFQVFFCVFVCRESKEIHHFTLFAFYHSKMKNANNPICHKARKYIRQLQKMLHTRTQILFCYFFVTWISPLLHVLASKAQNASYFPLKSQILPHPVSIFLQNPRKNPPRRTQSPLSLNPNIDFSNNL